MRIAFTYPPGRRERLAQLAAGETPTEFFYGAVELAAAGHSIEHFEIPAESSSPIAASVLDLLRRACLTPPKTFGHTLVNAWALSPALNEFDCIVATVGHHGFALAACAALGRLRRPVVALQCGMLHFPYPPARRVFTRALLNRSQSVLFGEAEYEPLLAALSPDRERVTVNQFGVDSDFWTPYGPREDFVLAIGNDSRRDYPTLLAAAVHIRAPIRIVTRLPMPDPLPSNVTVLRGSWHDRALSDVEIRELYRRAACVVTPLHDTLQPSGQSVTLQAMACGAPVVLTRTRGLWNEAALRDGENVRLVPPADPAALSASVSAVLDAPARAEQMGDAGRAAVLAHGHIRDFAQRLGGICERSIARRE